MKKQKKKAQKLAQLLKSIFLLWYVENWYKERGGEKRERERVGERKQPREQEDNVETGKERKIETQKTTERDFPGLGVN